jgi:membrane protease YdiL (CAAX protease family)
VAAAYLFILILNISGEELWWRGYILPRQEVRHGKLAWIIHGIFWTLFHIPFWWNLIALLPSTLSLSYMASKLKNSTPGIIAHFIMNGLGLVMIILGVLGVGG